MPADARRGREGKYHRQGGRPLPPEPSLPSSARSSRPRSRMFTWSRRDDTRLRASDLVLPEERLSWGRTIGLGMQHVVAMFGATFLVPIITGFPPSTTLLFSGVGTILFLLITK